MLFCLWLRAAAYPTGQNGERQLLPADAGSDCKRNPAARFAAECSVRIAAGLPLTSFGRDKPKFRDYLLRSKQPVNFRFEGVEYSITIEEVAIFPQGYAALMTEVGLLQDEPSMLLMDLGGWTVDLMRIDNAIPVADTAHSLELGMIRCVDDIREQVRRETGLSLTDAQMKICWQVIPARSAIRYATL